MGKIVYEEMPGTLCGFYDNDNGTIHVDPRLRKAAQRNTIVHEQFHRILGHGKAPSPAVHTSREVAVQRLTAHHLISLPALMKAMVEFDTQQEQADALGVSRNILMARMLGLESDEQLMVQVCVLNCIGMSFGKSASTSTRGDHHDQNRV